MAFSDTKLISIVAGATFSTGDLYKAMGVDSSGNAVLYHNAAGGATGGSGVIGTLDSVTSTTSAAGVEAIAVQTGPIVKAFMEGSTVAAGDLVTWSTNDSHCAVATTNEPWGVVLLGTSGSTGRIYSVIRS